MKRVIWGWLMEDIYYLQVKQIIENTWNKAKDTEEEKHGRLHSVIFIVGTDWAVHCDDVVRIKKM